MKVSVVIPAKNEVVGLGKILPELMGMIGLHEIIVVNDGSTDETFNLAKSLGANVISHPYSKGNGAAIKTGARAAKGDVIIFMDGDGQHKPSDIPKLIEKIRDGYDMVIGARGSASQASLGRFLGNKTYNLIATYMVGHRVVDLTSGFRAVSRDKFMKFIYLLPNGFSYPTTITMSFFRAGFSVFYLPIQAEKRVGASHIHLLKDGMRFFLIIFKIGTLFSPLKLFVPFAGFFFFAGMFYYGYTYLSFTRFTNMSALLFICSILVFLIGLVSEQITSLIYKHTD